MIEKTENPLKNVTLYRIPHTLAEASDKYKELVEKKFEMKVTVEYVGMKPFYRGSDADFSMRPNLSEHLINNPLFLFRFLNGID